MGRCYPPLQPTRRFGKCRELHLRGLGLRRKWILVIFLSVKTRPVNNNLQFITEILPGQKLSYGYWGKFPAAPVESAPMI